jgi:cytochrome c556
MLKSIKLGAICAVAAAFLLAGGIGGFAQDKMAQVKARQDFMKAQGADAKAIGDYAKGEGDQAKALAAANDLIARSGKITDLFPAGTSSADVKESKAKPELWKDWDKVKMIPDAMHAEELKLIDPIKAGDMKAVGAQMGAVGKAGCGNCHNNYRVKAS